ncbi:EH signature domain-containing protein [Burkholderia pseudomallei]|uniref:EH signature domain-containing protein n=1 Tax=Burkholderia pseudomallei TaxID=28450 RepID=UPI001E38F248|nr:EH signature domain-containing protein [Burkholderia pseudomallei]
MEAILIRYHSCKAAPQDERLRDYVCQPTVWKNPKLKAAGIATAWNRVPDPVWHMVLTWVNERNLKDFFDILAARNNADEGRLAFWSKYLKQIIWTRLVFGADTLALKRSNAGIRDLIAREEGAYAQLTSKPEVDAFMMQIGSYLIIEFSKKPNACYVYQADQLPFEPYDRHYEGGTSDLAAGFRQDIGCALRIVHRDGWGQRAQGELRQLGIRPDRPNAQSVASTGTAERINFDDIYELDGYSGRVEGIGAAKPIYVPVFQKEKNENEDDRGWLPSDLTPMVKVTLQGQEGQILVSLTKEWVQQFDEQVKDAEEKGLPVVTNDSLPTPVATAQARTFADSFKSTLAAKKLKADFRIACTGTPVENSLADLWCLFDFVQPGLLGALEEFGKGYRRPIECETDEQKEALKRLQAAIAPQTLRRTKADIATDLPKKYFGLKKVAQAKLEFKPTLGVEERLEIALTEHQRILYKGGLKKLQDAAKESNGRKRAQLSFGALHLMKAVCAEPYCLPGTKFLVDKSGRDTHLANSPKLAWLLEHLAEVKSAGEKAIVFTELREAQAALYYFLKETFSIRPYIINGDSEGRQGYIDKFSAKPGFDVIILSTLAAGAGLNVTAANHVFHFTRAWNPSKEAQATDRAFRIGQERDVFVYCPTVVADDFCTFEVRLDQLLKRKADLAGATLDDGGLTAMLNGGATNASFTELVGDGGAGEAIPKRYLTMDDVDRMDGFRSVVERRVKLPRESTTSSIAW